jgi:hypothetical protein
MSVPCFLIHRPCTAASSAGCKDTARSGSSARRIPVKSPGGVGGLGSGIKYSYFCVGNYWQGLTDAWVWIPFIQYEGRFQLSTVKQIHDVRTRSTILFRPPRILPSAHILYVRRYTDVQSTYTCSTCILCMHMVGLFMCAFCSHIPRQLSGPSTPQHPSTTYSNVLDLRRIEVKLPLRTEYTHPCAE